VLPLLYLHGLSSSDFVPALEELFGSAAGLSASVITRLCEQWQAEREAFQQRDLSEVDYVYCFADGVHFSIRLGEQGRLCCLVIVGVRADGRKELVAVADGTRESTDDWAELLRDLRRRGMPAPVVMWVTGRLGCGGRCGRSSLPPANSAAGCTWSGMSLGRCPRASTPAPAGP
jgi:transposase-like protein